MPYTVYELRDSESGSVDTDNFASAETWNITKKYVVGQCPGGMAEAKTAIEAYVPRYAESEQGYWRRKSLAVKSIGNQCFEITAEYTTLYPTADGNDPQDNNGTQMSPGSIAWDATGVTEHTTSALAERVYGGNDTFDMAVNVQGQQVLGVDKVIPSLKYSETWIMGNQVATSHEFVKAIYTLTGTTNAAQFRAFSPGEALFMGARSQASTDQPFSAVTFDFQVRANNENYYVHSFTGVRKEGWDFVWCVYEDNADGGRLVKRPRLTIVNQMYEKKDWSPLRITSVDPRARARAKQSQAAQMAAAAGAFLS